MNVVIYSTKTDRSVDVAETGRDLRLDSAQQDLQTQDGDLGLTFGADSIVRSLLRRLSTGYYGAARWFYNSAGFETDGVGFGSQLSQYLSRPESEGFLQALQEELARVASQEDRISVTDIAVSRGESAINLQLTYRIRDDLPPTTISAEIGVQT